MASEIQSSPHLSRTARRIPCLCPSIQPVSVCLSACLPVIANSAAPSSLHRLSPSPSRLLLPFSFHPLLSFLRFLAFVSRGAVAPSATGAGAFCPVASSIPPYVKGPLNTSRDSLQSKYCACCACPGLAHPALALPRTPSSVLLALAILAIYV